MFSYPKNALFCKPKLDRECMITGFKENYENKRIKYYMNIITYCMAVFQL